MIENQIIEVGGAQWKIREAVSMEHALNAIASARCMGSIGQKNILNETYMGGGITVQADVIRINSDGTEAQPYQPAY